MVLQTLRSMVALEQSLNWKIYYAAIRGNIKAPFKPVEIRVEGFRLGFLAVTQMVNEYQKFPYAMIPQSLVFLRRFFMLQPCSVDLKLHFEI